MKEETIVEQITEVLRSFAMPTDLLIDVLDYIKKTDEQEKDLNHKSAKELQVEQAQLTEKLGRLTDLLIDGNISKDVYETKNKEIQLRRQEIESRMKQMEEPFEDDKDTLGNVITMLSKSAEMFASSKTEQKRQMLGFVFSNLQMEGSTLRYSLRKPFEVFQQVPHNPEWRPLIATIRTHFREPVLNLQKYFHTCVANFR